MSSVLIGTSFVHLEHLFAVSTESVSYSLVLYSVGYLLGALVCGLLYDRLPAPEVSFVLSNVIASVATVVAAVVGSFVLFTSCMALQGAAFGYNDAGDFFFQFVVI